MPRSTFLGGGVPGVPPAQVQQVIYYLSSVFLLFLITTVVVNINNKFQQIELYNSFVGMDYF
jgi:hypothetical protein